MLGNGKQHYPVVKNGSYKVQLEYKLKVYDRICERK
jgi:hypothetical protein